jgi:transposase-like protein
VARELGLKEQTLGRWVHDFRDRAAAGEVGQGGLSETERAELLRLRRENSDLKLDRAKQPLTCDDAAAYTLNRNSTTSPSAMT